MAERYDVVIVGARCAGSPLAVKLANRGLEVALVDRARFPSDTPSTHVFQNDAARVLADLGVLDRLLASGAPWVEQADLRVEGVRLVHPWPRQPRDPGPMLSVRRPVLDTLLVEAAAEAGAHVRTGTRVTGLVERDGRVVGVAVRPDPEGPGSATELLAPLVVGADGRGSAVGRLAGARRYNLVPNERMTAWAYYEGASPPAPTTFFAHRWDEEYMIACPCDGGLYLVIASPPADRAGRFVEDADAAFDAHLAGWPPVAGVVAGGRRTGRPAVMARWTSYFREAAGPGWVLVGDAGHFKDPAPGQGIADALRQVERLAPVVVEGLDGSGSIDRALTRWWRWRDRDAREMAWFAADVGGGGRVPPVLVEILRQLQSDPVMVDRWFDVLNHRARPSEILTPPRLLKATAALLRAEGQPRRRVLSDTGEIVARDLRRRWLNRFPRYRESAGAAPAAAGRPVVVSPPAGTTSAVGRRTTGSC